MTTTGHHAHRKKSMQSTEQDLAKQQIDLLLKQTRPKNLREGVTSGVGNILATALGAAGIVVVSPFMGMARGAKQGGLLGGVFGLAGGAVVGALGAVAVAVGGAVSGVTQILRGVAAVPDQMMEPSRGKWWDEFEGEWVRTDLKHEKKLFANIPEDDEDVLGAAREEAAKMVRASIATVEEDRAAGVHVVADMQYYDALEVGPKANRASIKRQYYELARQYHPDRAVMQTDTSDKFTQISEAYQVLSNPELREKYDKEGTEGLSADKTQIKEAAALEHMDPALLFTFLFGSTKFTPYVGTLAMATSASIGDDTGSKISIQDARIVQKRRCTRLALELVEHHLKLYVDNEDLDVAKMRWQEEAKDLVNASYGDEMLGLIGKVYSLASAQFLGALDSGIGMPGISKWAEAAYASMKSEQDRFMAKMDTTSAAVEVASKGMAVQTKEDMTSQEKEKQLEEEMFPSVLKLMWATTVVDVTNTLHETCQMVFFDQSVDVNTRKARAEAVRTMGDIFAETAATHPKEEKCNEAKRLYEDAAFGAMLETIARKEEAAHKAGFADTRH